MDNNERLEKMIEEVRQRISEGWRIEAISVSRYRVDSGGKSMYIELEISEE